MAEEGAPVTTSTVVVPIPHAMKVDQLKQELSSRGLAISGTKPQLQDRLTQALVKDLTVETVFF